jgi:hypothetical protein
VGARSRQQRLGPIREDRRFGEQVSMGIDQPRHQRSAAEINRLSTIGDTAAGIHHLSDPAILHEDSSPRTH